MQIETKMVHKQNFHQRHIQMAHHSFDLEGITTLLPISYFINGDKDYIEVTNP